MLSLLYKNTTSKKSIAIKRLYYSRNRSMGDDAAGVDVYQVHLRKSPLLMSVL